MAQSINIKVVIEGVEDIEQFIILKELKSYAIQGYLIGKQIHAKEIKSLIERIITILRRLKNILENHKKMLKKVIIHDNMYIVSN
ncbi:hypothetical protein Ctaglu_27960 [Clostridium tagluense]|uniref:EAL domain-containing protein n=2 Tax=Clostridium tagluense TaxID=360422 RepID=A0A401UNQ2_9CLOT|nr:hypothetical protein Ctaglu_27960 [Clostridium tagluense]